MTAIRAFEGQLPSEFDMHSADQLRTILANAMQNDDDGAKIKFTDDKGGIGEVVLTHGIAKTFLSVLRLISNGQGFSLIPYKAELTTQQAADLLNVSRPYLIKLLVQEDIGFKTVGRHRRIRAEDLFEYRDKRDQKRSEALSNLAKSDAEQGLI